MEAAPAPERITPLAPPHPPELAGHLAALMPRGWQGPALGLFRVWARHLPLAEALRAVGRHLLAHGALAPRERELLNLRTTARCGAEYEWGVHAVFFPARVGLDAADVAATRTTCAGDPRWSERDGLLLRLADALHDDSDVPDPLWQALAPRWSEAELLEMLAVVGFYHLVSFTANALRLRLEPFATHFPDRAGTPGP
jgi:alkylhydroperoxidase family enzyme